MEARHGRIRLNWPSEALLARYSGTRISGHLYDVKPGGTARADTLLSQHQRMGAFLYAVQAYQESPVNDEAERRN